MSDAPQILLLNGPNLNLLGTREPELYGTTSLEQIEIALQAIAETSGVRFGAQQSNHEGVLVEAVHEAAQVGVDIILINPGAYGHTSLALRDAFLATEMPFIEVHLTNTTAREEPIRQQSLLSDLAMGRIEGFGALSYELAAMAAVAYLSSTEEE